MEFKFDSSYILYGLGALLAIISVIYFSQELILNLSPTIKVVLLFIAFVMLFIGGNATDINILNNALYIISAAAYLTFLFYTSGKFDLSSDTFFTMLFLSSILFVGLGYLIREKSFKIDKTLFRNTELVLLGVMIVLVGFDMAGSQPSYDLSLNDQVTVGQQYEQLTIGTVTAENPFILSRELNPPQYSGCLYVNGSRVAAPYLSTNYYEQEPTGLLYGRETRKFRLETGLSGGRQYNVTGETFSIDRQDTCPESLASNTLVVVEGRGDETPLRPVY